MSEKKIVYIAGPITGVSNYRETFKEYEGHLTAKGYTVLNPTAFLPEGLTNEQYMHACLNLIDCADAVLFLPGSEDSKSAQCEFHYCRYIGKPHMTLAEFAEQLSSSNIKASLERLEAAEDRQFQGKEGAI